MMPDADMPLGKPRPLGQVLLRSVFTGLIYYGYYKWVLHDELKAYRRKGWSGALCVLPFAMGVVLPQALWILDPDVPSWFGWFSLVGIVWIYIIQFRLYRTVNQLYLEAGNNPPLIMWWLFCPGLNIIVGLRQIHFLGQYWADRSGEEMAAPLAKRIPWLSSND